MPRRWVWSLLDIVALICLGQATIVAQRQAAGPPPRLDAVAELSRTQAEPAPSGTRILETGGAVVVALRVPARARPPLVAVDSERIRLTSREGAPLEDIPIPAGADPARYSVRLAGDELRVIFTKAASAAGRRS